MTGPVCASCIERDDDLQPEWMNGRRVLLCRPCREESLRAGRWTYAGPAPRQRDGLNPCVSRKGDGWRKGRS
jgi:hypothetical protein